MTRHHRGIVRFIRIRDTFDSYTCAWFITRTIVIRTVQDINFGPKSRKMKFLAFWVQIFTRKFSDNFSTAPVFFFGGGTIALLSPPPPLLHDTTKHIDKRAAYIDRRPHTCRPMACSMIILYRTLNFKFKLVVVGGSFSVRCAVGNRRPHICWHMAWLRMCYIIMLTVEPLPWNI